jgi:SMC interacting uncharacterized protein involved in chromosome segregation
MRERLTDKVEQIRQAASNGVRREISDDFQYNKKKLKHLKHILHKLTVSVGTMMSALNEFSRVKGRDISPDGMLGGLGYIMPLKDIKEALVESVHKMSAVTDCIADELTNPKWNAEDDKDVKDLIKEKEQIEETVEEDLGDVSEEEMPEQEMPEEVPEEDSISPEDIITSTEDRVASFSKETEAAYAEAVRRCLINAGNNGKGAKI